MIIIPIGSDCQITFALRDNGLRQQAFPFDWVVSYGGVADIIKNKFRGYLPTSATKVHSDTYFMHNTFPDDLEQLNTRINRFLELLNTSTEEIVFIRRGHSSHHHQESDDFHVNLKNDLLDCQELADHLKKEYPNLKFKIILILICGLCFDPDKVYQSTSEIQIHNIAHSYRDDDKFHRFFNEVLLRRYHEPLP